MYGSDVYMEKVLKKRTVAFKVLFFALIIILAAVDQLTKWLVVEHLKPIGSVTLIGSADSSWLNLTYCENTGMSFSLLEGQRLILIGVPILLIAAVVWVVMTGRLGSGRLDVMIALAALAGGGLGNLIDRVFQGYVVDFIDVRIINFAIFNFADICAVCGGIWFGIAMAVDEIKEEKAKKAACGEQDSGSGTATENSGEAALDPDVDEQSDEQA